jgi:hypothetical protein
MLPILRIIPVGGVLLAIAILVLALHPPVGPHAHFTAAMTPARGPLLAREEHPEWRQFLILAALRRANELSKLRDLPDTPTKTAPLVSGAVMQPPALAPAQPADAGQLAGVQPDHPSHDDITGTVQSPDAAIPVDIGETSSFELPVIPHEEKPPVIMMPAREIPPPDIESAPERIEPKPQSQAAPEPANEKHASRETAPAIQPKQAAPKEAAPKITTPPIEEIKAAAPAPVESKQASREVVLPPVKPKLEIQQSVRKPAKPRHETRHARRRHRAAKKQEVVQFDLFRVLFGLNGEPPGKAVQPNSIH